MRTTTRTTTPRNNNRVVVHFGDVTFINNNTKKGNHNSMDQSWWKEKELRENLISELEDAKEVGNDTVIDTTTTTRGLEPILQMDEKQRLMNKRFIQSMVQRYKSLKKRERSFLLLAAEEGGGPNAFSVESSLQKFASAYSLKHQESAVARAIKDEEAAFTIYNESILDDWVEIGGAIAVVVVIIGLILAAVFVTSDGNKTEESISFAPENEASSLYQHDFVRDIELPLLEENALENHATREALEENLILVARDMVNKVILNLEECYHNHMGGHP